MVDPRVPTASAVQAKINFQIRIVPAWHQPLLVCDRKLRDVAVSRAGLRQVAACTL